MQQSHHLPNHVASEIFALLLVYRVPLILPSIISCKSPSCLKTWPIIPSLFPLPNRVQYFPVFIYSPFQYICCRIISLRNCSVVKINHSVARQCVQYTVVTATQQVHGKWQFWGCQNSVTPEPIDKKLTRDYVGELTSYTTYFIEFGRTSRQCGEMYILRTFLGSTP